MSAKEAVFTRESITKEEEEEAAFTRDSITKEDPPNAHQAQRRPKPRLDECVASVYIATLQRGSSVHSDYPVDTCQGP